MLCSFGSCFCLGKNNAANHAKFLLCAYNASYTTLTTQLATTVFKSLILRWQINTEIITLVNLSRSCRKGYSHHPWWWNTVPCGNLRQGGDAGSRGSKAALGSSLRKGKRLVTFDFTLLHLSSVILSCPCVPLLSIEEKYLREIFKGL